MKRNKKTLKRYFATFMTLVTCFWMFSTTVFAEEIDTVEPTSTISVEFEASAEETTASTEETKVPAEETTAPAEETKVPAEGTTTPAEEATVPTKKAETQKNPELDTILTKTDKNEASVNSSYAAPKAARASYTGKVTLYGTPEKAIKSGPTYGNKVTIDLGTRTGQSWNNVSYTIPQVSEYFELNDGWVIDYVSVAGNSSSNRQPGASFLLSMSGGSMVYYFKQVTINKTFTLNYNANGGNGAPSSQTATSTASSYSFTISSAKPTRTGYDFLGWSTDSSATSASYSGNEIITVSAPPTTTLYAVWKQTEQVTLTYIDRNVQYAKDTLTKGDNVTVKDCTNTRSGYTFCGWSTSSTATEATYERGDSMAINENTILYAVWQKDSTPVSANYTVKWYDVDGNEIKTPETRNGSVESTVAVTEADKTLEGYTFDRENDGNVLSATLAASGTVLKLYFTKNTPPTPPAPNPKPTDITKKLIGVTVNGGTKSVEDLSVKTGDVIVLTYEITVSGEKGAKYVVSDENVTLENGTWNGTLDADGKAVLRVTKTVTATETGTLTVTNTAYVKPDEGTDPINPNDDPEKGNPSNEVTTEITVTEPNPGPGPENRETFTVTWLNGYGGTVDSKTYDKQTAADKYKDEYPADPTREGYTFTGWGEPVVDDGGNITITAQWNKNSNPVDPNPVNPDPVNPDPVNPDPVNPDPVNPDPVDPNPVNPDPVNPNPVNPDPVNPEPVEINDPNVPLAELADDDLAEIDETDVPLANMPLDETPDDPDVELDDPSVPLADVPRTGDDSHVWAILAFLSGAGLVWLALEDRKRKTIIK